MERVESKRKRRRDSRRRNWRRDGAASTAIGLEPGAQRERTADPRAGRALDSRIDIKVDLIHGGEIQSPGGRIRGPGRARRGARHGTDHDGTRVTIPPQAGDGGAGRLPDPKREPSDDDPRPIVHACGPSHIQRLLDCRTHTSGYIPRKVIQCQQPSFLNIIMVFRNRTARTSLTDDQSWRTGPPTKFVDRSPGSKRAKTDRQDKQSIESQA